MARCDSALTASLIFVPFAAENQLQKAKQTPSLVTEWPTSDQRPPAPWKNWASFWWPSGPSALSFSQGNS